MKTWQEKRLRMAEALENAMAASYQKHQTCMKGWVFDNGPYQERTSRKCQVLHWPVQNANCFNRRLVFIVQMCPELGWLKWSHPNSLSHLWAACFLETGKVRRCDGTWKQTVTSRWKVGDV
jgi:hypothetical protein